MMQMNLFTTQTHRHTKNKKIDGYQRRRGGDKLGVWD